VSGTSRYFNLVDRIRHFNTKKAKCDMGKLPSKEFSGIIDLILKSCPAKNTQEEEDLRMYVRLILSIAKAYIRTRVEYEDLVMAGIVGLLEARQKFDPSRSDNFKAYAAMRIQGEIYSYYQKNVRLVSVPTHISKASSYVEKIYKYAKAGGTGELSSGELDEVVLNYDCELEEALTNTSRKNITYAKDRIAGIAKNSRLSYEALAKLAKDALVCTVSDSVLISEGSAGLSVENIVTKNELKRLLRTSLKPPRFRILQLHAQGYNNPDISRILFEEGYTNPVDRPISRAAVKNLLDSALAAVKDMEIFSGEPGDN